MFCSFGSASYLHSHTHACSYSAHRWRSVGIIVYALYVIVRTLCTDVIVCRFFSASIFIEYSIGLQSTLSDWTCTVFWFLIHAPIEQQQQALVLDIWENFECCSFVCFSCVDIVGVLALFGLSQLTPYEWVGVCLCMSICRMTLTVVLTRANIITGFSLRISYIHI